MKSKSLEMTPNARLVAKDLLLTRTQTDVLTARTGVSLAVLNATMTPISVTTTTCVLIVEKIISS